MKMNHKYHWYNNFRVWDRGNLELNVEKIISHVYKEWKYSLWHRYQITWFLGNTYTNNVMIPF